MEKISDDDITWDAAPAAKIKDDDITWDAAPKAEPYQYQPPVEAAYGEPKPGELWNTTPGPLGKVAAGVAGGILDIPRRAIEGSQEDVRHLGQEGYEPKSIAPAADTALAIVGMNKPVVPRRVRPIEAAPPSAPPEPPVPPEPTLLPTDTPHEIPAERRSLGAAGASSPLSNLSPDTLAFLRKKMQEQPYTHNTLNDRLDEMSAHQFLGEITPSLEQDTQGIAGHPGPGKHEVVSSVTQRHNEARERIQALLDSSIGKDVNTAALTRSLKEQRAKTSTPLYEDFRQKVVTPTPELEALEPPLRAAGATQYANNQLEIAQRPSSRGFLDPDLENIKKVPTAEAYDIAKQHLDKRIGALLEHDGTGPEVARLVGLKNKLTNALDSHPEVGSVYKQARVAYEEPSSIMNAQNVGERVLTNNMKPDEIPYLIDSYSDAQKNALRVGMRSYLENLLNSRVDVSADVFTKVLSPNGIKKIRAILGDDAATDRLVTGMQHERNMRNAPTRLLYGAPTANRTRAITEWGGGPELPAGGLDMGSAMDLAKKASSPVKTALTAGANKVFERVAEKRRLAHQAKWAKIREEAGPIFTLQGPERDAVARELFGQGLPRARGGAVRGRQASAKSRNLGGAVQRAIRASKGYAEGGAPELSDDDQAAMMPETFVPEGVRKWTEQAAPKDYNLISGSVKGMATLPQRAIESARNYRETGEYDPGPILEAATLPMGTGAIAGLRMAPREVAFGAGPIRMTKEAPQELYHVAGPEYQQGDPLRSLYARKGNAAYDEYAARWPEAGDLVQYHPHQNFFYDKLADAENHASDFGGKVLKVDPSKVDGLHFDKNEGFWTTKEDVSPDALDPFGKANSATAGIGPAPGIRAYHGSPHDFDKFDLSKIGTGEGAQAYGHGLYFAEHEPVAKEYRDVLTRRDVNDGEISPTVTGNALFDIAAKNGELINGKLPFGPSRSLMTRDQIVNGFEQGHFSPFDLTPAMQRQVVDHIKPPGRMYEVNINADPSHFLDWDKPLSQQSQAVREKLTPEAMGLKPAGPLGDRGYYGYVDDKGRLVGRATTGRLPEEPFPGSEMASSIARGMGTWKPEEGAAALRQAGIPGIKYLDQGSRGAGEGSSNYVVFNHDLINIVRKYALAGIALPPAIAEAYDKMQGRASGGAVSRAVRASKGYETGGAPDYDPFAAETFLPPELAGLSARTAQNDVGRLRDLASMEPSDRSGENVRFKTASPLVNITDEDIDRGINAGMATGPGAVRDPALWHGISSIRLPRPISEMSSVHVPTGTGTSEIIKPAALQNSRLLPLIGDRSVTGSDLTQVNGFKFADPVEMQGGHGFMAENADKDAAWASAQGVISGLAKKIRAVGGDQPVHGVYTAMGEQSADFSHHVSDTLAEMLKHTSGNRAAREAFDEAMRTGTKDFPAAEDWPGIRSKKLRQYLADSPGKIRSKFAKTMDMAPYLNAGFPSVAEARLAVTDPRLLHEPTGASGLSVAKLDPSGRTFDVAGDQHRSYDTNLAGKYVGGLPVSVPKDVMYPDIMSALNKHAQATFDRTGFRPSTDYLMARTPKGLPVTQEANQKWVDGISKYLQDRGFARGGAVMRAVLASRARS